MVIMWTCAEGGGRREVDGGGGRGEWRGASVTSVDGDAADGIRPSHCEGSEVDT